MRGGVNISLVANKNYWSILNVCIYSMLKHFSDDRQYNIFILNRDIGVDLQIRLNYLLVGKKNVRLVFVSIKQYEQELRKLFVDRHLSVDTYARFYLPELLNGINKVLYIDVDTIICDDLAKLYDVDLGNYLIGGVLDRAVTVCNFGDFYKAKEVLKAIGYLDFSNYINAGVLLFNLGQIRLEGVVNNLFEFSKAYKFVFHDQDVINYVFRGRIKVFGERWNFTTHCCPSMYAFAVQETMMKLIRDNDFGIIHYPGADKPWNSDKSLLSGVWRQEAIFAGYYSESMAVLKCKFCELDVVREKLLRVTNVVKKSFSYKMRIAKYKLMKRLKESKQLHYQHKIDESKI